MTAVSRTIVIPPCALAGRPSGRLAYRNEAESTQGEVVSTTHRWRSTVKFLLARSDGVANARRRGLPRRGGRPRLHRPGGFAVRLWLISGILLAGLISTAPAAASSCGYEPATGTAAVDIDGPATITVSADAITLTTTAGRTVCRSASDPPAYYIEMHAPARAAGSLRLVALDDTIVGMIRVELVGKVSRLRYEAPSGREAFILVRSFGVYLNLYEDDSHQLNFPTGTPLEVVGSSMDDLIRGSDARDRLYGGEGNDTIQGFDGRDLIDGGPGDDVISGDAGRDDLYGGPGADTLGAADGEADRVNGGPGDDTIRADDGAADRIFGGKGVDTADTDARDVATGVEQMTKAAQPFARTLATAAKPKRPPASNYILVDDFYRVDYIRLDADFGVHQPPGCPVIEPSDVEDPAWDRWYSSRCEEYRDQSAELYVQVMHNGKVAYEDDADGYDGHWTGRIYKWELETQPACSPGTYKWTVVLRDPYHRRGMATSSTGHFSITCS